MRVIAIVISSIFFVVGAALASRASWRWLRSSKAAERLEGAPWLTNAGGTSIALGALAAVVTTAIGASLVWPFALLVAGLVAGLSLMAVDNLQRWVLKDRTPPVAEQIGTFPGQPGESDQEES